MLPVAVCFMKQLLLAAIHWSRWSICSLMFSSLLMNVSYPCLRFRLSWRQSAGRLYVLNCELSLTKLRCESREKHPISVGRRNNGNVLSNLSIGNTSNWNRWAAFEPSVDEPCRFELVASSSSSKRLFILLHLIILPVFTFLTIEGSTNRDYRKKGIIIHLKNRRWSINCAILFFNKKNFDFYTSASLLTPRCRQCPLEDDRFATCGLPMTSICSETVKKNCNNSLKD